MPEKTDVDDFHQWLQDLSKHEDDRGWKVSKYRADKSFQRDHKNCYNNKEVFPHKKGMKTSPKLPKNAAYTLISDVTYKKCKISAGE